MFTHLRLTHLDQKTVVRFSRGMLLAVLCALSLPAASTSYFHQNFYAGSYYRYDPLFRYDNEIVRLRDSLRAEQRRLQAQTQLHEVQALVLRNQVDHTYRVSAGQACYYRKTGGYEACADMFISGSDDHVICEEKVQLRNPGCT